MCIVEPKSYHEAVEDKAWQDAMNMKIKMIEKNKTWELVERLADKPVIEVKWMSKTKLKFGWNYPKAQG